MPSPSPPTDASDGVWSPLVIELNHRKLRRYYGLQPELETYKSIIKACLVGKEFNMALTTLFDLQKSGRRADQETWDMLIEICAVVGKWDAALEIIRDIFAEEVRCAGWGGKGRNTVHEREN